VVEAVPLTPAAAPSRRPSARVLKAGWARQPGERTQGVQDCRRVHRFVLPLRSDAQHGAVLPTASDTHREADDGAPYELALSTAAAGISRCIDWTGRAVPQTLTPLLASPGAFEVEVSCWRCATRRRRGRGWPQGRIHRVDPKFAS
jgi:hypothetical protein